ncbi:MAG TPA: type II toxin-antitoxin system VapC family toxin [Candidatus Angelobacter sp.]
MRYLLDTNVFLWSIGPLRKLNQRAQDLLSQARGEFYLSAASAWEITIKSATGKLKLPEPPERLVPNSVKVLGLRPLPITQLHALAVGSLPLHHQDPFDRILIAQARSEDMVVMTTDHLFSKYPVQTLWCGT